MLFDLDSYDAYKFNNAMSLLHSKLYHDRGEVECFLRATEEQIRNYNSIFYQPEILITVGNIINAFDKSIDGDYLANLWKHQKRYARYYIDFIVPYVAVDMNILHKYPSYFYDNREWFEYSGYTYDDFALCSFIFGNLRIYIAFRQQQNGTVKMLSDIQ